MDEQEIRAITDLDIQAAWKKGFIAGQESGLKMAVSAHENALNPAPIVLQDCDSKARAARLEVVRRVREMATPYSYSEHSTCASADAVNNELDSIEKENRPGGEEG